MFSVRKRVLILERALLMLYSELLFLESELVMLERVRYTIFLIYLALYVHILKVHIISLILL